MFVLHPSSRCDVCLEAFSSEDEMVPYAIPCGHVFCKTCLDSVVPPKCPMCRKNFDPSRMKKLHVDRPEGEEDPREADLLQRVVMSFDASEDVRQDLLGEVETYLTGKADDIAGSLRKAKEALAKFHELRENNIQGKRDITVLKREMREKEETAKAEKERSAALEMTLLARANELQSTQAYQLASAQGEIEHLRAEIQRRTQLKNPLPAPPQPISLDRYAGFGQGNTSQPWFNDNGRSMLPPARGHTSLGVSYVHPRNLYGDDDRENHTHVLGDANGAKRDRKGKSRERPDATNSIYGSMPPPYLPPHETSKPKAGIIPGASPKSKFVPPDPEAELERGLHAFKPPDHEARQNSLHRLFDPARDVADPYSVLAATIPEYANGFAEGYHNGYQALHKPLASGSGARDSDPDGGSDSDRGRQERRRRRREKEKERERRERDSEREHREHRSRRERPREGERGSASHRTRLEATAEDGSSSTPSQPSSSSRGQRNSEEHRTGSRAHRQDRTNGEGRRPESSTTLAMLSENPPQRRRTMSRSQTTGPPQHYPPAPQPARSPPVTQPPSRRPSSAAPPLAQPTPRIPPQPQQLESLEQTTADIMHTPASRHSIQSTSTVESWGTVSDLPPPSPSSFLSLNLRTLPAQAPMPSSDIPFESPARPSPPPAPAGLDPPLESSSSEEEEGEDGDETEVEDLPVRQHHSVPVVLPARSNLSSRPDTRNRERAPAHYEHNWGPHPVSAPAQGPVHGSRHTQTISIPEPHHIPTMPYPAPQQPFPSAIQSASAAIPDGYTRQSRNRHASTSQRDVHRSRNSASQVPGMNERVSGHRQRRTSLASVPTAHASVSSLSLNSNGSASASIAPPVSAPATGSQWDHGDAGYHTDIPSSGNALGLAISATERDYTIRTRPSNGVPISQPKPVPIGQTQFLRSLSRDFGSSD